jgi:hypothetical protein
MGEAMPRAEEIGADVFATAQQVAGRFFLLRGNVDGGQRSGAIEERQLNRVAAVGLDAVARPSGNQAGCNDVARIVMRDQRALQLEAARPGLGAALDRPGAAHALDEAQNRRIVRRQLMNRRLLLAWQQDRGHGRRRVLIDGNDGSRLRHDRPPLYCGSAPAVAG